MIIPTDENGFVRDITNSAVLNNNEEELNNFRARRQAVLARAKEVENIKEQVNSLSEKVDLILQLLQKG